MAFRAFLDFIVNADKDVFHPEIGRDYRLFLMTKCEQIQYCLDPNVKQFYLFFQLLKTYLGSHR